VTIQRHYIEAVLFVATWMCLGWVLHLGPEVYLLIGIPLVLVFQTTIRRKPVRALWVRDSERFRLRPLGIAVALALALIPASAFALSILQREWTQSAFLAAACVGAIGAGFAGQYVGSALSRRALLPLGGAVAVGIMSMAIAALTEGRSPVVHFRQVPSLLLGFITYVPVCFALEEVAFRGALDTHVWLPEGSRRQAWVSAFLVSSLWGVWHLPILGEPTPLAVLAAAPVMILAHAVDGAFIAFSWRASGSLLLPAIYHSLVDAYRDTIQS